MKEQLSLSLSISKKAVLLAVTVLLTACGTGISLDPFSFDRPHTGVPGGDGSPTEAEDASPSDDVADAGSDASIGEDRTSSDGRADAPELFDRTGDSGATDNDVARDGSDDGSADASVDRSGDAEIDRDASIDAGIDRSLDAIVERDNNAADSGGSDVAGESRDAPDAPDAPRDGERDVVTADVVDGCTADCGQPDLDYYVDASAPPGGDGSKEAPFRTISAAIDAHAHVPNQARKAHVAAGTYDEALGETFPLVLRGLSLEGAGADKTFIVGSGTFDHAGQGGPKNGQYMVTVVAGDRALPTKVARLSVRPVAPVPSPGYHGLFCDRGNATGEVASPAGQTHLDETTIGPGYDTSLIIVSSTIPVVTGCNLLITRSTVTGGWNGVEAQGCMGNQQGPVMLQMGTDDPTSGNTVSWMQSAAMGAGVFARDCVVRASFQYNTISDCNNGLVVEGYVDGPSPGSLHLFSIKNNTFARMTNQGLIASGASAFIEEVSGNRFFGTTRSATSFELAVGMRIWAPVVGKIRRNVFVGNDVGLMLNQGTEQTDVGRPGDPGGNVFSCNSGIDGWSGADVMVYYQPMSPLRRGARGLRVSRFVREDDGGLDVGDADPDAGGGDPDAGGGDLDAGDADPDAGDGDFDASEGDAPVLLPYAGNSWDHVPQNIGNADFPLNGLEIRLEWTPPLFFDLSGSTVVTDPCPAGRVP